MVKEPAYEELLAQNSALKKQAAYLASQTEKADKKREELEAEVKNLTSEIKELKARNNWFMEQLKLSKKKIYGSSAEKIAAGYGQLNLFNEAEAERTPLLPEPKIEEITVPAHTRRKKRTFEEKYGNLPVEEVVEDIAEEEKACEKCGSDMTFLRYESRKEIKVIPAQVKVIEYKRAVYVCRDCDKNGIEATFKTAAGTAALIEKSLVSPSLMAYIMNQKFTNAMPLYRQEQELARMGVKLSRQTMANWMISGARLLKPLYDRMREILVSKDVLHADETTLEVLRTPGNDSPMNAYMWVYRSGREDKIPIVLYDFKEGRSGDYPKKFLSGFSGYLHCDGLRQYDDVLSAKRVGCWAHTRRYFKNALDVQHDKKDYSTIAGQGFLQIEKIFFIEGREPDNPNKKSNYTLPEIAVIRKDKSKDLLVSFFEWCEKALGQTLPKSLTGKAVSYALKQKASLMTFLEDPRLELTNNAAERAVKPFVIGRKNWLFCNTPGGANSSAIIYSIIETAKENNLKPFDYLVFIFEKIRNGKFDCSDDFLPWNSDLPKSLYIS